MELQKHIARVILGIRFQNKFSLLSDWGNVFDNLLNHEKGKLNREYFPKIGSENPSEKILLDPINDNHLRLTSSNIIYQHTIKPKYEKIIIDGPENKSKTFRQEFRFFRQVLNNDIYQMIKVNKITDFNRIGIVYAFEFENEDIIDALNDSLFKSNQFSPNSLRFSIQKSTKEAKKEGIDDYINIIFDINKTTDGHVTLNFDYQKYYIPNQKYFSPSEMKSFIDDSYNALKEELYERIESYEKKK